MAAKGKKKSNKKKLILLKSEAKTGVFFVRKPIKDTKKGKLVLRKYDPVVRKHVKFVEHKAS